MKKISIVLILFLTMGNFLNSAEGENWKAWFENFLKTIKYKMDKNITTNVKITAVAAVRGKKAKDESANLYWKGTNSTKAQEKIESDRKTIKQAIENALNGNVEKAREQLNDFINKNPDSSFLTEAKEALEKLPKEEIKENTSKQAKEEKTEEIKK